MKCPNPLSLKTGEIDNLKCIENKKYWISKYSNDITSKLSFNDNLDLSNSILPCHTFAFDALKPIFGYNEQSKKFVEKDAKFLCSKALLKKAGKKSYDPSNLPPHMKESIDLDHDLFIFAYHGVHNPYQRKNDIPPIKPFGIFLKKDIEHFSYAHGCPWDVNSKNANALSDIQEGNLDKYYLFSEDLRYLKTIQLYDNPKLKEDFWYYFGNPDDWQKEKGYGKNLFETAGEMRYYNEIIPENIAAILWPFTRAEEEFMDQSLDLLSEFERTFTDIKVIKYTCDTYNNNMPLSLVEASYYTQLYYLKYGIFESNAAIAKVKMQNN